MSELISEYSTVDHSWNLKAPIRQHASPEQHPTSNEYLTTDSWQFTPPLLSEIPSSKLAGQKAALDQVRSFYLSHETDTSKRIIDVSRQLLDKLRGFGDTEATLLFGGSVGFGQATDETSNLELVFAGRSSGPFRGWVKELPAMMYRSGLNIVKVFPDDFETPSVQKYIGRRELGHESDAILDSPFSSGWYTYQFEQFLQVYWLSRHLDASLDPLFDRAIRLADHPNRYLKAEFEKASSLNTSLSNFGGWRRHYYREDFQRSFDKYHQRLSQRGIQVPPEILGLENDLLEA